MDPGAISAAAAVASLIVAGAAVLVANRANEVAQDAVEVAKSARDISSNGVEQARRLAILSSVPSLTADRPKIEDQRTRVYVLNGGPGVAYGILVSVAGSPDRRLDAVDEKTRRWSGRQVSLKPGPDALRLTIEKLDPGAYQWIHLRLEYMSPLGAQVTQDYLGPTDPANMRYRLHRVTIRANEAEILRFDLDLGPFDEADPGRPPPFVGVA